MADVGAGDRLEALEIGEVARERLARVHERRAGRQRLAERRHGAKGLVLDRDQLERLPCLRLVVGDDGSDRLALVPDDVDREHGAVAEGGSVVRIAPVEIRRGHDGVDAARGPRRAEVDGGDARVRVGRAQERRVQHARQREVGDVARASRHLVDRVRPRHRVPDDAQWPRRAHRPGVSVAAQGPSADTGAATRALAARVATARIASTILR
jgi:hypothetical protein